MCCLVNFGSIHEICERHLIWFDWIWVGVMLYNLAICIDQLRVEPHTDPNYGIYLMPFLKHSCSKTCRFNGIVHVCNIFHLLYTFMNRLRVFWSHY